MTKRVKKGFCKLKGNERHMTNWCCLSAACLPYLIEIHEKKIKIPVELDYVKRC